jgi:hypothetical protein
MLFTLGKTRSQGYDHPEYVLRACGMTKKDAGFTLHADRTEFNLRMKAAGFCLASVSLRSATTMNALDQAAMEIGARLRVSTRQNRTLGYKIIEELRDVMQMNLSPIGADDRLISMQALFREFASTLQERSELFMQLTAHQAAKLPYHN